MNKQVFTGKTREEAIIKAKETLNAKEAELVIVDKLEKKSLFNKKCEIEVVTKEEMNNQIKRNIQTIVKNMGIEAHLELKIKDGTPYFNLVAPNTSVLIGRSGRTIEALQTVISQMINSEINTYYRYVIDVNDYKENRKKRLEKMAKYTAKDVAKTKTEAHLEPMNAFERRIIHTALSESKDVMTESEGEGKERHVVIKLKEAK